MEWESDAAVSTAKSLPVEPSFLEETCSARIPGAFQFGQREHFFGIAVCGVFFRLRFAAPAERADCVVPGRRHR